MRHLLVSAAPAATLASSSSIAADLTAKGNIKSMDNAKCTITLADGKVYQFAPRCDVSKLKANESVVITYTVTGSVNNASKVAAS